MEKRIHFHENIGFIMKISLLQVLILIAVMSMANANSVSGQEVLNKKISLRVVNGNLRGTLTEIERLTEVRFIFQSQVVPATEEVTIVASNVKLSDALNKILNPRKIRYEVDGNQIILIKNDITDSQGSVDKGGVNTESKEDIVISGAVTEESGMALPGVNVLIKGTSNGTTTDGDGKFSLTVADEGAVLIVSFIGYVTQEVPVGNKRDFNIKLQSDISTLSEVVVVGYGTQKKADVIGSISTVEGSQLNMKSMTNVEAGLQGLAAGVSVQSQSGAPGAPVRVLIRGANSINLTTDPLYIIDGMPISVGSSGIGSSNQGPMSLINPNDIESITVLKDAAATSIYGTRASNGIVLVTTKSGKDGKGVIDFNYTTGFSSLTRTPSDVGYANTSEWFKTMDKAYENSGLTFDISEYYKKVPLANNPLFSSPQLTRSQAENINTNWYDELFHTGVFSDYNLSSSRGSDKGSFYLSTNYRKDNGVQRNNNLERFTVRSNLDFKPNPNVTIGSKMTFAYSKNDQRNSGITSISVDALPWLPVHELDNPNRYYNAYVGSNAVAMSDPNNVLNRVEQFRGLGGVFVNYKLPFIKGLSLRSELSGDVIQSNKVNWQGTGIRLNPISTQTQSAANEEAITYNSLNYNAYATYEKNIGDHSITFVGGAEATRSSQFSRTAAGTGLIGKYPEIGAFSPTNITSISGSKNSERYLLGYFGRVSYKFKERYLFGVSVRRDGSSVFAKENRWGTFLSGSAGWILSEERFMSFLGDGIFLKLRGSYGETGNQNISNYLQTVVYNTQPVVYGGSIIQGVNGTIPTNVASGNLQWEATKSSDVGIDFGIFHNRLNGSVAYYHRLIDKQLLPAPVAPSAGISSSSNLFSGQGSYDVSSNTIWGNFGSLVNSGFELELHSVNANSNGFKWTTDFNIAFTKSVIKALDNSIDRTGGGLLNGYGNAISRKGERRYTWYIADYAGVDPVTGVPMIYARDAEKYQASGETDRQIDNAGQAVKIAATNENIQQNPFYQNGKSGDPKYQAGLTNTLSYKGFDLTLLVVFSGGNYILDYDRQHATSPYPAGNILREVYDKSWKTPGDIAKYPELKANFSNSFSGANVYYNRELYKGDYLRVRNIQLGYNIPASITGKLKMQSVRAYISGSNLFTATKYPGFDPEGTGTGVPGFVYYANAIPQLKTITVGLNVRF